MTNRFYSHTSAAPASLSRGTSSAIRAELDSVAAAFDSIANSLMAPATESGTTSNYLITLSPMPTSMPGNGMFVFQATHTNAGASTFQIGTIAAIPLLNNDGTALAAGNISAGTICCVYTNAAGTNAYLMAAPKSYVDGAAFSAVLPGQGGNSGKWLQTNGATASWQSLTFGSGTVSAPAITVGDAATGFYKSGLNQVSLSINGSQIEVDASTGKTVYGNLVFGSGITFPANMTTAQLLALTGAPKADGTGASGTWSISITGTAASCSGNAATATNAAGLASTNWTVTESGGKLYFKYGGANKMSLDSSGNLIVTGNVTAYGTP